MRSGTVYLPLKFPSPFLFLCVTLNDGCTEQFGKFFDPWRQRFYCLLIRLHPLECCKNRGSCVREEPYLAVFQNEAETSSDRLERAERIRGVSHGTEEQFGRGRCSSLPIRFTRIRSGLRFDAQVRTEGPLFTIRNSRGTNVLWRNNQRNLLKLPLYLPSGFELGGIARADGW